MHPVYFAYNFLCAMQPAIFLLANRLDMHITTIDLDRKILLRGSNNSSNNNNRRSLLFLLGSSSSDGMSNHPASAWFHNSLQHLSHSWHRFNKFGISRDKKADRCSTWFVDQADNNNKPLPFFSFSRFVFCPDCVYLYIFR